jgi:GRIP domain
MSLMREREFNSSTSEVNVEYLVNILRKFLMTHDLSERAKLVTVLCSILHLRGDDAKVFHS